MGQIQTIRIAPGSQAGRAYGQEATIEKFFCNYGLNPLFRSKIEEGNLKITGVDPDGDVRIVELPGHRFYVATLFLPQAASKPGSPHPLIFAYVKAAHAFQSTRRAGNEIQDP